MRDPNSGEAQLTPEARALMGRARRSFLFSIGLLLVGFLAVGAGIVYKSTQVPETPAASGADYALAAVKLPSGAEIVSAVAADGRVSVTYRNGATTSIRIFDGRTGEILREIPVVSE
jgi:multidrug efflux pump subunit AcrA (membrane-fusion protein)